MEADEKECPFCAEIIKAKAKVCKHCGREMDVSPPEESQQKNAVDDLKKSAAELKTAGSNVSKNFKGCGGCLFLLLIIFGVIGMCRPSSKDEAKVDAQRSPAIPATTENRPPPASETAPTPTVTPVTEDKTQVSAAGKLGEKTEDQKWQEKQPALQKAVDELFTGGAGVEVEITKFTPQEMTFWIRLRRPATSMKEAEDCAAATVIRAAQWAAEEGRDPSRVFGMRIRATVVHPEKGVTGKDMVRIYGRARYSSHNDQVNWEPEG